MNILFGIAAQGMGHATRSRVLIEALARRHRLLVVTSGIPYQYLSGRATPGVSVLQIPIAQELVFERDRVHRRKTVRANLWRALASWRGHSAAFRGVDRFAPDLVVSDFDRFSAVYAKLARIPLWTVDNLQTLARCKHPREMLAGVGLDLWFARWVAKLQALGADHYFITTFFRAAVRTPNATLHPPILRPEIAAARPAGGDHLLVYQGAAIGRDLISSLRALDIEARIYAPDTRRTTELIDGKLRFRPFSEAGFIEDLSTARGVVSSAGSSLIGEALYLRRAMLALPIGGMVEQRLNAGYLAREGLGMRAELAGRAELGTFLERIPEFERRLAGYAPHYKTDVVDAIERSLATL
jgi:uncharacterized protein (TIGR00661 family)